MTNAQERILKRLLDRGDRLWEQMQEADERTQTRLSKQLVDNDRLTLKMMSRMSRDAHDTRDA